MVEGSKSLKVTQLFIRGCHDNLSEIYLTQNLFHKNQRLHGYFQEPSREVKICYYPMIDTFG